MLHTRLPPCEKINTVGVIRLPSCENIIILSGPKSGGNANFTQAVVLVQFLRLASGKFTLSGRLA